MASLKNTGNADPRRIADLTLAAAVRSQADSVFIEPMPMNEESYLLTFERGSSVLASVPLDASLGSAVIARLGFLAALDVSASHPSTGILPVRSGNRDAEMLITVRPGSSLRADLTLLRGHRERSPVTRDGPTTGDVVGNYRIVERLGEGGMGTVFSAVHVVLGRSYALKVLRSKVVEREKDSAQRFVLEARAAARIRHPNTVDVFDFGYLSDGRPYFVMELLEGESLAERVDRGALPPGEVVVIARQIATALAVAHEHGVIHADVTPSNIFIVDGDQIHVKLVDFGLATLVGEGLQPDNSETVLGTPAYISPEQLRGLAPTDRSDQYGLGAVLFELVTGHPPYYDPDLRTMCLMHVNAPIPPVESPHGILPPKLAEVITTCLQKTPQARFPGMRAMLAALEEIERVVERRGWRRWLSS